MRDPQACAMVLFHGSTERNLTTLCPRDGCLFASHDIRVASLFLAGAKVASCVMVDNALLAFVRDQRESLLRRDAGGSIYLVDSARFRPFPAGRTNYIEWKTTETVTPLARIDYSRAIPTIMRYGVQLYFVDPPTYAALEPVLDRHMDVAEISRRVLDTTATLQCENSRWTDEEALR